MAERSADQLVTNILADPEATEALKTEPENVLKRAAAQAKLETPLDNDVWVYRMVVAVLGFTVLLVALGTIALSWGTSTQIPDVLTALGSAAVGALAGLLAPAPTRG